MIKRIKCIKKSDNLGRKKWKKRGTIEPLRPSKCDFLNEFFAITINKFYKQRVKIVFFGYNNYIIKSGSM